MKGKKLKERRNVSADADEVTMARAPRNSSTKHPHGRSCIAPPWRKRPADAIQNPNPSALSPAIFASQRFAEIQIFPSTVLKSPDLSRFGLFSRDFAA
jgi:hypothetical protein